MAWVKHQISVSWSKESNSASIVGMSVKGVCLVGPCVPSQIWMIELKSHPIRWKCSGIWRTYELKFWKKICTGELGAQTLEIAMLREATVRWTVSLRLTESVSIERNMWCRFFWSSIATSYRWRAIPLPTHNLERREKSSAARWVSCRSTTSARSQLRCLRICMRLLGN